MTWNLSLLNGLSLPKSIMSYSTYAVQLDAKAYSAPMPNTQPLTD